MSVNVLYWTNIDLTPTIALLESSKKRQICLGIEKEVSFLDAEALLLLLDFWKVNNIYNFKDSVSTVQGQFYKMLNCFEKHIEN